MNRLVGLDDLDLKILHELQLDGRLPVAELARRIGVSRQSAFMRLRRLLDGKVARIATCTSPLALGYRTLAMTGVRVSPGQLQTVAERLKAIPNVFLLMIAGGWTDIIIWSMFRDNVGLSRFMAEELGTIPGLISTETMIIIEWHGSPTAVLSSQPGRILFPFAFHDRLSTRNNGEEASHARHDSETRRLDLSLDQTDFMILQELERDGRKSLSDLARRLSLTRSGTSARIRRLLDGRVTTITASIRPIYLGYNIFTMIGIGVSPKEINAVVSKIESLPDVFWVAKVAGRYDLIVGVLSFDLPGLARFLTTDLGGVPGVLSLEPMIGLEVKKWAFEHLVSLHLATVQQQQRKTQT